MSEPFEAAFEHHSKHRRYKWNGNGRMATGGYPVSPGVMETKQRVHHCKELKTSIAHGAIALVHSEKSWLEFTT